jgi:hypothetical protein
VTSAPFSAQFKDKKDVEEGRLGEGGGRRMRGKKGGTGRDNSKKIRNNSSTHGR